MARRIEATVLLWLVLFLGAGPLLADETPRVLGGYLLQENSAAVDQVITSKEELAKFAACIPATLPQKRGPEPPNPDPLRGDFTVDFEKEILVIAVHRDTLSAFPNFLGTSMDGEGISVDFEIPEPPPEAKPDGWGVYTAVVLPKSDIPTRIERIRVGP